MRPGIDIDSEKFECEHRDFSTVFLLKESVKVPSAKNKVTGERCSPSPWKALSLDVT